LKLLNEVFVFDEVWQECVKAYTISLFLSDLVSGLPSHHTQTLDELRGMNIVNFDEAVFFESIKSLKDKNLLEKAKDHVHQSFIQSLHVLKYLKAITSFFRQVTELYFPKNFEAKSKKAT